MHIQKHFLQLAFAVVLSAPAALPLSIFDRLTGWYIDNQIFLTLVFLAVAIDHILGSVVHFFIVRDFSAKKNLTGLLVKGFSVVSGYVLFEMIHQIVNDVEFIATYFKVLLQLTVMLYPVLSALKNLSIITGGKFPPDIWFKKFTQFNTDLDLSHFKTTKNENINPTDATDSDSDIVQEQEKQP